MAGLADIFAKDEGPLQPGATGEMRARTPSFVENLAELMGNAANAIGGKPLWQARQDSRSLLGMVPFINAGENVTAAKGQAAEGNYGEAALAGGAAALDLLPAGLAAKSTGKAVVPGFLRGVGRLEPLPGAPSHVTGPVPHVLQAAEDYAARAGISPERQFNYGTANPRRGAEIAKAYDRMPHAPQDPAVNASYEAMAKETMAQWEALQRAGTDIEFMKPGMPDPYPGGPKEALADLRDNNHLWVFPTESGFGPEGSALDTSSSPLLASTGITHKGHPMLVNDAFRAVHDYFGHGLEGANFGARGEENAWRAHSRLYSPEALPAVTSETRGQNSWVNFGPYGEANRANQKGTVFADQKTGIMPAWTQREGGMPPEYRARQVATGAALAAALAGRSDKER